MLSRSRVLAVVNQKGGVGKTTTAVNLAASFAAAERATLLIDLDPQGNASTACGVVDSIRQIYDVLIGDCVMKDAVLPTALSHLHVVPSGSDLVGAEIELVTRPNRERRLESALADVRDAYEFVIVDCPPSLGILTLNALTAADGIVIPLQCEYYALEGLASLLATLERVRGSLNPRLNVEGIVLTMVDLRNNLTRQVEAEVRSHFGDRVYQTKIPRNVRLSEAPSHGMPALLYDAQSSGSKAYVSLCYEILNRLELSDPPLRPPMLDGESAQAFAASQASVMQTDAETIEPGTSSSPSAVPEDGASSTPKGSDTESPQTTQSGPTGGANGQYA